MVVNVFAFLLLGYQGAATVPTVRTLSNVGYDGYNVVLSRRLRTSVRVLGMSVKIRRFPQVL
jgi:hypothetical protein